MRESEFRKLALQPFDDILKVAKGIAKAWDLNTIPMAVLKQTLKTAEDHAKTMGTEGDIVEIKEFYLSTYNNLYKVCLKKSKEMGSKSVAIKYLESCINTIKTLWIEAREGMLKKQ